MPELSPRDCTQIKQLLAAQIQIIREHIAEHKWYRHLKSENEAIIAFVDEYGFIMREMYCRYVCPNRFECKWAEVFIAKNKPTTFVIEYEI